MEASLTIFNPSDALVDEGQQISSTEILSATDESSDGDNSKFSSYLLKELVRLVLNKYHAPSLMSVVLISFFVSI